MRKGSKYSAARAAVKSAVGAGGPRREASKLQGNAPAPSPEPDERFKKPSTGSPFVKAYKKPSRLPSLGPSDDEAKALAKGAAPGPSAKAVLAKSGVETGGKKPVEKGRFVGGFRGDKPERKWNGVGFGRKDWRV